MKSGIVSTLGMSKYSTPNLCIVQVATKGRKLFLVSVYIKPREDEHGTLNKLDIFLQEHRMSQVIIGGDFNGWHTLWGSSKSNKRGLEVNRLVMSNNLIIGNTGNIPTFETVTHGISRTSIIDLTLYSYNLCNKISDWKVNMNACPSSEHNAIDFILNLSGKEIRKKKKQSTYMYNTKDTDWTVFNETLEASVRHNKIEETLIESLDKTELDNFIQDVTKTIQDTCNKTLKIKHPFNNYLPWWNEELESLKRQLIKIHHTIHDLKKSNKSLDNIIQERGELKERYALLIRKTSTEHFRDFCNKQGKENVWSLTNRLLKNAPQPTPSVTVDDALSSSSTALLLLNKFFPDDTTDNTPKQKQLRIDMNRIPVTANDSLFTEEEVLGCLRSMNANKAPGPDHLTADICLAFSIKQITLLTKIMNRCLKLSHFPENWKIAQVIPLPKPNKSDYSNTSSYRPIGLINIFGKLLEKLICQRISYHLEKNNKSNSLQFGFKQQTSTTDALKKIIDMITAAKTSKQLVIAISLDIQAAFDNAWWPLLFKRLKQAQCPQNLYKIILSYIQNRKVSLNYADTTQTKVMTRGCIQGSVCGPLFWNIILDDLFEEKLPDGCHLQAFADDVLLIVNNKKVADLETTANKALKIIFEWGKEAKLSFAPSKTQLIAFTPKAKAAKIIINNTELHYVDEIKVLGIIVDKNLKFIKHVKYIIDKSLKIYNKLSKFVRPTWGAQPENIRIIYKHVIVPIITYAAGIWGSATKYELVKNQLRSLQRGFAIKIIRAFKTVSATASIALAGLTPLHLKVDEVAALEKAKMSGITPMLPDDIPIERPAKSYELLHPADRKQIIFHYAVSQIDINKLCPSELTQIYTDGSKHNEDRVGAAFVAYKPDGCKIVKKFKLHPTSSVYQAELFAIENACSWATQNEILNIAILSDSLSSLKEIENKDSNNRAVVSIHKYIRDIESNNGKVIFIWVKSHIGINGNEEADEAAKEAAESHKPFSFAKFPLSFLKHKIKSINLVRSDEIYNTGIQGNHTRKIFPNLKSIHKLFETVSPSFEITQVLTGHGFHLTYLHKFKIKSTDKCPCDHLTPQSLQHLIENCPRYTATRLKHTLTCNFREIKDPYDINEIINKDSTTKTYLNHIKHIINTLKTFNENIL